MEFIVPLTDKQAIESTSVTMECEVNKPDLPAKWLKEGEELSLDERIDLTVDLTKHAMTITNTNLEDEAQYTIVIDDKKSSAVLLVDGRLYTRMVIIY